MAFWKMNMRETRGFTMAETLVVIGIIVVLMGVSVPNLFQMQRSLRITELDAKAEQIYNEAQFQMSLLKSSGRLAVLSAIEGNTVVPSDYQDGGSSGLAPAAEGAKVVYGKDSIRYSAKGVPTTDTYVIPKEDSLVTSGVTPGSYVVELSPMTGEVYAVFYWESDAGAVSDADPTDTSASGVEAYYKAVNGFRESRTAANSPRSEYRIGYYNGGKVSDRYESDDPDLAEFKLADLQFSLENEEELYIRVFNPAGDLSDTDFDLSKLKLSIFIQELKSPWYGADDNPSQRTLIRINGGTVSFAIPSVPSGKVIDDSLDYGDGDSEIDYILDSMYESSAGATLSFTNIVKNYIRPGSNVEITVYAEYEDMSQVYGPERANSLFGWFDTDTGMLQVNSVRHFSNLADYGDLRGQIKTIELTSDITFDGSVWNDESVAEQHRDRANRNPLYEDQGYDPLQPINLTTLMGNGKDKTFDGGGHSLVGFVIGDSDNPVDDTGLFRNVQVNVQNITLVEPVVYGANDVGALVGRQTSNGLSFDNCQVVGGTVTGAQNVGGLFGYVNNSVTVTNCSSTASVAATGAGSAGGLVGVVDSGGMTFEGCTVGSPSASSVVKVEGSSSSSYVGGFIGEYKANATIKNCTAYANVSGGDRVGGFLGGTNGSQWSYVTGCSAMAPIDLDTGGLQFTTVSGREYVGGFIGYLNAMNDVSGNSAQVNVSGTDYVGGFAGYIGNDGAHLIKNNKVPAAERNGVTYVPWYDGSGEHVGAFSGAQPSSNCDPGESDAQRKS